ncbi:MAG TPA: hypothetical protein V6D17_04955, partial [Candidatus Obscuribacterales bacterium]
MPGNVSPSDLNKAFLEAFDAPPAPDNVEALRKQIREHEEIDRNRGLFQRIGGLFEGDDERSLTKLKEVEQQARLLESQGKKDELAKLDIPGLVNSDRAAIREQDDASHYASSFVKGVTLFLPNRGKLGWLAPVTAGVVHGLDQVKLSSSVPLQEQAVGFTTGFAKGAAIKLTMDKVSGSSWRTWEKGLVIGGSASGLETVLTPHNWRNERGEFSTATALSRTVESTALGAGTGAVIFPVGHRLFKGASKLTAGRLESSPLASNMGIGFTFGASSGFTGEALTQFQEGKFDPARLTKRTIYQAGIDSLAGAGGHTMGKLYAPSQPHAFFQNQEGRSLLSNLGTAGRRFVPQALLLLRAGTEAPRPAPESLKPPGATAPGERAPEEPPRPGKAP